MYLGIYNHKCTGIGFIKNKHFCSRFKSFAKRICSHMNICTSICLKVLRRLIVYGL